MKDYTDSKIPRLYELMNERNVKAKDISQATGISAASFTDWKKGNMPTPAKLKLLADYFGVSLEYLTGSDQDENALDLTIQSQISQLTDEQKQAVLKYIKFVQTSE